MRKLLFFFFKKANARPVSQERAPAHKLVDLYIEPIELFYYQLLESATRVIVMLVPVNINPPSFTNSFTSFSVRV